MPDRTLPISVAAHPTAEMVKVIEHRHTRGDSDLVSIKLGVLAAQIDLLGTLNGLQLMVAEMARGLVAVEDARRGPEGR